ncbi:MAG: DUF3616 domain-containing protein [Rhodomicrobiaceae bacterium]
MSAAPLSPQIVYRVEGLFDGKGGGVAADLSGAACMPPRPDGSRLCLFINDESRRAQFATVNDRTIFPGDTVKLTGKTLPEDIPGSPPEAECPGGEDEHGEFDGEGVAYAEPYFYVVGSHGCSRRSGKFNLASFLLARIKVNPDGIPADENGKALPERRWGDAVELTYRLSEVLRRAEPVGAYFAKSLDETVNGLNIEGLAVDGKRLLVGLRAPCLDGSAFIVSTELSSLFAAGDEPSTGAAEVIPLTLGQTMGIRDLASLPDGRLVVLAGSAQDQPLPYRIFVAEPRAGGALAEIGELEPVPGVEGNAKAEALAVLGVEDGKAHVLVLFDGAENGAPIGLTLRLP